MQICRSDNSSLDSRGFSIVEVLAALLILSLGLLALGKLQLITLQSSAVSKERSGAVSSGLQKLEELRSINYASLPNCAIPANNLAQCSDNVSVTAGDGNSANFIRTWTLTPLTNPTRTDVSLEVTWTDGSGKQQRATLNTVLNNIGFNNSANVVASTTSLSSTSTTTSSSTSSSSTSSSATSSTTTASPSTTTAAVSTTTTTAQPTTTTTAATTTSTSSTTTTTVNTPPVVSLTGSYASCTSNPATISPCININRDSTISITFTATDNAGLTLSNISVTVASSGNQASVASVSYSSTTGTGVINTPVGSNQDFTVTITITDASGLVTTRVLYFKT